MLAARAQPDHHHQGGGPRSGRGAGAGGAGRGARRAGVRPVPHLPELPPGSSAARRLRRRPAPRRGRRDPGRRVGRAVVPGDQAAAARDAHHPPGRGPALLALPDARLPRRSGAGGHAAARRWPRWRTRWRGAAGRPARWRSGAQRWAGRARASARPRRRRADAVQADEPIDMVWLSPLHRRRSWTTRPSWSTSTISTRPRRTLHAARQLLRARRRPAGSAGAWAPRSGPSWPRRTRR